MHSAETLTNLQKFLTLLNPSLNLDEMLANAARQLVEMFQVDHSGVLLFGEDDQEGEVIAEYPSQGALRLKVPLTGYPLVDRLKAERKPIAVLDAQNDPIMGNARPTMRALGIKSIVIIPLVVQDKIVGSLSLDAIREARAFTTSELNLGHIIGNQIAVAVDYTRALEIAATNFRQAQTLREISRILSESLNLAEILPLILAQLEKVVPADSSSIYLLVEGGVQLAVVRGACEPLPNRSTIPLDTLGGVSQVIERKAPLLISDTHKHHQSPVCQNSLVRSWLGLPLGIGGEIVGVLNIDGYSPDRFNQTHVPLVQAFANQAAIAIHNARLYGQAQKRADLFASVQEITSTLNASLDLEQILNNACELFTRLIEVDHCGVALLNEDGRFGQVVAEYPDSGIKGIQLPLNYPAFLQMRQDRQPFASFNAPEDPRLGQAAATLKAVGVKSILVAPLVVQDQVIGSIGLDAIQQPRSFTDEELNVTRIVADQMAIAITNARTYQAERTARLQADTLREVAATLNETLDLDQVLERILAQLERVITYDSTSIILREEDRFRVVAARGFPDPDQVVGLTLALAEKPHFQEIARTHRPLVIPNTDLYDWRREGPTTIKSWIGAPLIVSDQLIGLLAVDHGRPDFYGQADGELVMAFADLAAVALENARLYQFEVKQVEQELHIARQIQRGFFPRQIPTIPGWQIAAVCLPARETGGDFYEFVSRSDGLLGLIIGDVSGKSITAAMLMAAAQSVVEAKGSDHRSPARVLAETNRLLYDDVPPGAFVALSYALLAPADNTICLSNGGQLDPFLVPANGQPLRLVETPGNRLPLGVISEVDYQETSFTLAPGDLLVFYTDGIVECKDATGRLFGFEGLASVLAELRGQPPDLVLDALLAATDDFANGAGPHDDVTLLVVQRI